jgi:hypothetical protein
MKADQIIKNAKIFTSDKNNPQATALVVKDGKFVYVGDEAGLSAYEGKVTDLGGKFIMPGIIDSHMHVTIPVGFEYAPMGLRIEPNGKQEALNMMADYVKKNPGEKRYRFLMEKRFLNGDDIVKEELDAICPDAELQIQEGEGHSIWVNSKILKRHGITDETPDPIPGLAFYVRKDGHVTGNMYEGATEVRIILDSGMELTDEQVDAALQRWIDFCVEFGVTSVFDAGLPGDMKFHEKVYKRLCELDKQGKLPVYVDGCLVVNSERDAEEGLKQLKRIQREYNTEHLKVHTMKIFMDGTQKIHTAAMVTPYVDVHTTGATAFSAEGIAKLLKNLNEANLDLHLHTVGERASRTVLDGVEMAKKEMGDDLHVRVTCAHLEIECDDDLDRFAKLGVFANFTPHWHAGDPRISATWLGEERSKKQFRCKTVWDSGATVAFSSDNITFMDFMTWNPYLGMEVGMTRLITEKTRNYEFARSTKVFPPEDQRMGIEEMLLGFTINGAKQLGIEASKGSIEAGKDADFLVFDNDLLTAEHEGFSYNKPRDVYFSGKKLNSVDYSKKESWYQIPEITKDIDTFYIYATEYILGSLEEGAPDYATLDNAEMLEGVKVEYRDHASAFADSTNVFLPYYRQSGLRYAGEIFNKTGNADAAFIGMPYDDITAALDYYFENCNGGRPFIIAGHSQGSAMVLLLLRTYFKDHPEYYKRMVAAYTIGYSVTKDYLAANPHLKFATGESDTGVIIAWNTEGPKNVETNAHNVVVLPNTMSINPLNWKLDETYAPASLNMGSIVLDEKTGEPSIEDIGADAQINLARGVVVTHAKLAPVPEEVARVSASFFGPDGRHAYDYMYYYKNIKANVAKRVAAYLSKK